MQFFKSKNQVVPQSIFSGFECHFFSDESPKRITLAEILYDPSASHLQDEIIRQLGKHNSLENWYFLHDLAMLESKSRSQDSNKQMSALILKFIDPDAKHEINISDFERNKLLTKQNLTIADFIPAIKTVFYDSMIDNFSYQSLSRLRAAELITQLTQYEKQKPSFLNRLIVAQKAVKSTAELFDLNAAKLRKQLIDLLRQETKLSGDFNASLRTILDSFQLKLEGYAISPPSFQRSLFEKSSRVSPTPDELNKAPDPRQTKMNAILSEIKSISMKVEMRDIEIEFKLDNP
jgi:hypothetical protein